MKNNYKEVDIKSFVNKNVISKERYEELRKKYSYGQDLSLEELKYLSEASIYFSQKEKKLSLIKNGYVNKSFALYIGFTIISIVALFILLISRV